MIGAEEQPPPSVVLSRSEIEIVNVSEQLDDIPEEQEEEQVAPHKEHNHTGRLFSISTDFISL